MKKFLLLAFMIFFLSAQNDLWAQRRKGTVAGGGSAPVSQISGGGAGVSQSSSNIKLGVGVKQLPAEWKMQGALVEAVIIGSPADEAGIQAGDIIQEFSGKQINKAEELVALTSTLPVNKLYKALILRGERKIPLLVMLKSQPPKENFKRKISDINVLKYALIDAKSRVVTLVGAYDNTYATGPIPYYDLLKEALQSPYPYFSLEPTEATRSAVNNLQAGIANDVKRMFNEPGYASSWAHRLMSLLLNDRELYQDHKRFIKKAAEAFKVSDQEVFQILSLDSNNPSYPTPEMQVIMIKVMRGLGYNNLAYALESADGTRDTARLVYTKLGRIQEIEPIWAKWDARQISEDQFRREIISRLYGAYLLELGMSQAEVSAKENAVRSGSMTTDELEQIYIKKLNESIVDNIGLKMFHGLTLSQALLSKMYNVPIPQMELVFKNIPAQTNLGKIMFEADYMFKTLGAVPEVKERVPGHMTNLEFLYEEAKRQGARTPAGAGGEVRNTILPGEVKMRVSSDGTFVLFDDARVKIESALIRPVGNLGNTETLVRNSFDAYGKFLTARYDAYAKAYPAFHRMREAAKLIALARWAKANNYRLAVEEAEGLRVSPPANATGFWNAIFTADQNEFSMTVVALGGADFSESSGDSWVQPKVDNNVKNDAIKQLVASTAFAQKAAEEALNGNLESARDLAEKSAQAMVGNIDTANLPGLKNVPVPPEPAMQAAFNEEVRSMTDDSLRAMEEAKAARQQADSLQGSSPAEAAALRDMAASQQNGAESALKRLNDAINEVNKNPANIGSTVVTLRGGGGTPFFGSGSNPPPVVTQPQGAAVTTPPEQAPQEPPAAEKPAELKVTGKSREELLAELAVLRSKIEATKLQLMKLNQSIQSDMKQFNEWEKVASDGMENCVNTLFGLLFDASAGKLLERYVEMDRIAQKLPGQPEALLKRLKDTRKWLELLSKTKTLKDINDLLAREHKTLPQMIEDVRDGLAILADIAGVDSTLESGEWKYKLGKYFYVAGGAWKYGSAMVDMAYNLVQYSTSWDAIKQLEENDPNIRLAVKRLGEHLAELMKQSKDVEAQLRSGQLN